MGNGLILRMRNAGQILKALDINSGTGPDGLAAIILKRCASKLAMPFCKLARIILREGSWPTCWRYHWILPLYKKKSVFNPLNYRGIQLTPQISKAMERFIGRLFLPKLRSICTRTGAAFGENQYAYRPGHGARDEILYLVCTWLLAFARAAKTGLYCSDVSGAFDHVDASRLCGKLLSLGIHHQIVRLVKSWLETRTASVVVGGSRSALMKMLNMVFQGTVWGPSLWNV